MSKHLQLANWFSPGGNLAAYMQGVSTIPILTAEEEKRLAQRLHNDGDLDSARQLVLSHLRFVVHIARSYSGYGLPLADLVQEGNIGLMKAVKRFDPEKGVRLVSFAVHWIRAEIHEYVLRNWRIVKVATTKAQRKLFFNLRTAKKQLAWLSNDEVKAVAADLGVAEHEVREMEGRLSARDTAFDAPVDEDEDSAYQAPAHFLEAVDADPAIQLERLDFDDDASTRLESALARLDARSRDIIQQRWLNDDKVTLSDLATQYHVSIERIRQIEQNAMNKVRNTLLA